MLLDLQTRTLSLWDLIETLWNVNALNEYGGILVVNELIETLWNVNLIESNTINKQVNELIETLWNVNDAPVWDELEKRAN